MGKAARLKKNRKVKKKGFGTAFSERFAENFQKEMRNSDIWDQMVEEFGEEKAEQLLKEFRADIKPGGPT